ESPGQRSVNRPALQGHRAGRRKGLRALFAAAGAAVVVVFAAAGPASAHATLENTSPAQSAVVSTAPADVSLTFDEAVGISADSIRVFDPAGQRVDDGRTAATSNPDTIRIGLRSGLGNGTRSEEHTSELQSRSDLVCRL